MDFDWSLVAQAVTATVAALFGLVKSVQGLVALFKKR